MDRFYTSPKLFLILKQMNIGACVKAFLAYIDIKGNNLMTTISRNVKIIKNKNIFFEKW